MIPRKEILKQINRYYDLVESVDNQIEKIKDVANETDEVEIVNNYELLITYFKLTSKVGPKMFDSIDDLKNELDIIMEEQIIKNLFYVEKTTGI